MDLKDILMNSENALPTLSTSAVSAQPSLPTMKVTAGGMTKFAVSGIAGILGMYYLASGKRENDVQKMLIGAALTIGSMFIF